MWRIPVNTPPLALATLAVMIQGQVLPVRIGHVRRSMAKDEGANSMSNNQAQELIAQPSHPSMANPCEEIDAAKQSKTFLRDLSHKLSHTSRHEEANRFRNGTLAASTGGIRT